MGKEERRGVVFDFDGTLTRKFHGALYHVVDKGALPKDAESEYATLREKYLPKIRDGSLEPIDELYWLTETFEIYMRHGVSCASWQKALDGIVLRPGVVECLSDLRARGVAVGIVSYGCADFIEFVLRRNYAASLVDSVLGARLVHDDEGLIVGYDRTTLVYPDNKDVWSRRFAESYGVAPERLLAVGDSGGDRKLGLQRAPALGIAEDEGKRAQLTAFFRHIVVIPDDPGDFTPVTEWLRLWSKS